MAEAKSTARKPELEQDELVALIQAAYQVDAVIARDPGDESHPLLRGRRKLEELRAE